jgi:plasmid stabilization system protein ParE
VSVRLLEPASLRIDEIYQFTAEQWGDEQADSYVTGLFAAIRGLGDGRTTSRPVPAAYGVQGFFFRYRRHFVYWRRLEDGEIGVVSILHERMQQVDRLREDFGLE